MIAAVDPGKHHTGLAIFKRNPADDRHSLLTAVYIPNEDLPEYCTLYGQFEKLYLERQYLTKGHPRPQDIVDLAFGAGWARGALCDLNTKVIEYQPMTWKGNVPKPIMIKRILAKLDPEEVARIQRTGYKDHNTIDAIGIGLYGLGRMQTGGIGRMQTGGT